MHLYREKITVIPATKEKKNWTQARKELYVVSSLRNKKNNLKEI
jgi:hypothetical protein